MMAPGPDPDSMVVQLQSGERIHYLAWPGDAARPGGSAGEDASNTTGRDASSKTGGDASNTTGMPSTPIVLMHDLTRTAWTWLPVGRRLARRHSVVAPDLRGHGASDAPLVGYELESLALDVLTVVAGAGWGEAVEGPPVVVAGHGLGAMIAVEMTRLQPASIAAVALLDGGWEEMMEATHLLPDQLVEAMADPPEVLSSMDAYLADRRDFDRPTWDADQEVAARAQVVEKHAGHLGLVTRGSVIRRCVDAMYRYQPLDALCEVRVPLALLAAGSASADDEDERERRLAIEDAQLARARAGLAPMVVRVLEASGHDLMRYHPDEITQLLEDLSTH